MREIKFRFWDSIESGWCSLEWLHDNAKEVLFDWLMLGSIPKEAHVMQFTGLQDRNGKDIYEGDIVQSWAKIGWNSPKQVPTKAIKAVKWNPDTSGFNVRKGHRLEVIGNIYENPQMLT